MNDEKNLHIPDSELDVMLVLWQSEEPMLVSDVHKKLQATRPCTKAAVHILIDRLAAKDFVKIEVNDAAVPYKTVTPLVSESDYRAAESGSFVERVCRGSWKNLIASLVDAGQITDADIDEITDILNGKK